MDKTDETAIMTHKFPSWEKSVATTSPQAFQDCSDHLDMQHAYLTARLTRAEGWRLTIDWGASEETSLAALWHFPLNKERKRESQQRFDFTYAWQCRSLHTAYTVIFYSSATLENSYFMSTVVCECPRVSACWCGERFGGYRVFSPECACGVRSP